MAGGEVIVNGSTHWHVVHTDPKHDWKVEHRKNPLSHENGVLYGIDRAPTPKGTMLRVTLRFATAEDAQRAIDSAKVVENPVSHLFEVVFEFEAAIEKDEDRAEQAPPNDYAQLVYEYGPGSGGPKNDRLASV